jgi:methyl-accepting chemotaxis protein
LDKEVTDARKIAYTEANDGITSSAALFAADLGKAIKNNSDGSLKKTLGDDGSSIAEIVKKLNDTANASDRTALKVQVDTLAKAVQAFTVKADTEMERLLNDRINGFYTLLITRLSIALASVIAGGLIFWIIVRSITIPLKQIASEIKRLSHGDYSTDVQGTDRRDEIGYMAVALNTNVRKIREIVASIKNAASSVNSAAGEISAGSTDLSMRTEQQASSLEETAASMEEVTGTVKQNSENAHSASQLSTNASTIADAGGKIVQDAVQAMRNIEGSSKKISDIIGVIDEIAFQTNLLALNAAVEAARAGDAGKGFAVVASEVRALAGRSASASKEIKTLINESASQVQHGAQLVNRAGGTLQEIVGSVKQVAGIVSDIASASVQQATGIDEINSAVTQMDEATQQNAALVEENTAAAQSMLEQAKTLELLIAFFKIENEHVS